MKTATENHKGFSIDIMHDETPENPFTAWDGNLPLMKINQGYFEDYSKGDINEYLANILTDGQIIRHQKEIAEAFEIDLEDFVEREFSKDDKISDIRYDIEHSKDFDALEIICKLSKTPYLNTCSKGYSQGDYADVFTCYTSKFEEVTGCTKKQVDEKQLQNNVDLWGYWAWGDVYGYSVEDSEGEIIDSCWGYYGDEHDKSGLLEAAKDIIDSHIQYKRKQRVEKLKELIKAHVSIIYRPAILQTI